MIGSSSNLFGNSTMGHNNVYMNNQNNTGSNTSISNATEEPLWLQDVARRPVPNEVIKREVKPSVSPTAQSSDNNNSVGFNTLTFGAKKNMGLLGSSTNLPGMLNGDHVNSILMDTSGAPPMVSITDWRRQEGLTNMRNITSAGSDIRTIGTPDNVHSESNLFENTRSMSSNSSIDSDTEENAVIVFGYQETITKQILAYFAQFGEVREDIDTELGDDSSKRYSRRVVEPIEREHGENWTKLTYADREGYLRALKENGTIYCGSVIGCAPYKRDKVKQLSPITKSKTNVLDSKESVSTPLSSLHTPVSSSYSIPDVIPTKSTFSAQKSLFQSKEEQINTMLDKAKSTNNKRKLSIRDGSSLFLKNNDKLYSVLDEQPTKKRVIKRDGSLTYRISNWLFGWNDL
ncbi:Nucleoporin ASM4 [Nakaseomyces bracarensis]|uniref:Nucleoporin ASM4 n=1 Tax=Nakaseomyces bracarensis TaxID=273131 RepID=A0ABR4NYY6_9SACH